MNNPLRRSLRVPVFVIIPVTVLVVVAVTAFRWKDENDYYFKVNKGLETFGQVYREVTQNYVDQVDPETFINAGIDGMLKTLDPYTSYLRRKDAADIDLLTSGTYGGIGITVGIRDSAVTIVDVVDGYSAQREGVRIGDKIKSINGAQLLHSPVDALREYTRGEPGTTLQMTVLRDGVADSLTFTLTRENIKVRSIPYSGRIIDGVGYIKLERFSSNAGDELRNALLDLKQQGAFKGVILDLRDNPGGLLESAVDVGSKFLPYGSVIVTTRGRDSSEDHIYRSDEEPIAAGVPLVVLINGGSASASEIVAGAIQDLDAGVILGSRSYGKGLVQSVRRLPYDATLKITTARYYTPSGRSIQKIDYLMQRSGTSSFAADSANRYRTAAGRELTFHGGIIPDTVVDLSAATDFVDELRDASIFFNFATRYAAGLRSLPEDFAVDNTLIKQFEDFTLENLQRTGSGSASLARVNDLYASAKKEGYNSDMLRKIDGIRTDLSGEERNLLRDHRDEIRRELYNEIVNRFRGQHERMEAMLRNDDQIQAAVGLLRSGRREYGRLLSSR
ncbi:MAG: Periplasmic protease [Chlorobi bacterium]|nr:Periplasmic protease [Chlorobiota bacterium]